MRAIDLNADLGEGFGPWTMGDDAAMLDIVTSANIACGGHAGDPETMYRTVTLAKDRGVVVGAHPSYPDLAGFGRRRLPVPPAEIERFVAAQVGALIAVAKLVGHPVRYVKPHGALANVASEDHAVAAAIVAATRAIDSALAILAISGSALERAARAEGMPVFSEVFADRGYLPDGGLVPRGDAGALIHDAGEAADRLVAFLDRGRMPTVDGGAVALAADSICIHGDSPAAVAMAAVIRDRLGARGVTLGPFLG